MAGNSSINVPSRKGMSFNATEACLQSVAKDRLLDFMGYCWQKKTSPLLVGQHTREITDRLDRALADYKVGKSSYIIIKVPFRHGKSDIVSRNYVPYIYGKCPDAEIILGSYNSDLAVEMSRDARGIFESGEYQSVFDSRIDTRSSAVVRWGVADHYGKLHPVGLDGGATGKGADVLILDDYLKNRADAENPLVRQKQWEAFTNNFMTRLAPVHIVIILATPWHVDDIIGRVENKNNPIHKDYSAEFPKFDVMTFPARHEKYASGYLFPERFNESWYTLQFATLGSYAAAALLQCSPCVRGGNMIKTEKVNIVDGSQFPAGLRWVRFWDLASTEKEIAKQDPDYTSGAKVAVKKINGLYHLYVDDVRWCQAEAPARNRLIEETAKGDGSSVRIGIESVAGYKDAYTTIKDILNGSHSVTKVNVSTDKVIRAGEMEPVFEAGNVHFRKAWWNTQVLEQLSQFPAGAHDDFVDSITGGFIMARDFGESRAILA